MNKDTREVVVLLEKQGWRTVRTKSSHWRLLSPNGKDSIVIGSTSSEKTEARLVVTRARHMGATI